MERNQPLILKIITRMDNIDLIELNDQSNCYYKVTKNVNLKVVTKAVYVKKQ